jgi:hypothetical protein
MKPSEDKELMAALDNLPGDEARKFLKEVVTAIVIDDAGASVAIENCFAYLMTPRWRAICDGIRGAGREGGSGGERPCYPYSSLKELKEYVEMGDMQLEQRRLGGEREMRDRYDRDRAQYMEDLAGVMRRLESLESGKRKDDVKVQPSLLDEMLGRLDRLEHHDEIVDEQLKWHDDILDHVLRDLKDVKKYASSIDEGMARHEDNGVRDYGLLENALMSIQSRLDSLENYGGRDI